MRRRLFSIALFFYVGIISSNAQEAGYDFSVMAPSGQFLYYKIIDSGAVEVCAPFDEVNSLFVANISGNLIIPDSVSYCGQTYTVRKIGEQAFYNCLQLTSIAIGNSVIDIGFGAFQGCAGLTSVTIPNSVTTIGDAVFSGCTGLTSVTIPNSVTSLGSGSSSAYIYGLFYGCTGLTSVTIPNSVTTIVDRAFAYCTGLTSVTIPNSVTSIGKGAFYDCTGLTSVTIPNSVTSVGEHAFSDCTGLTSVTIPNSVTSVGEYAFYRCTGLTSVTIPNSVTSIGESAFSNCIRLAPVTIPNSISYIGNHAFWRVKMIYYNGSLPDYSYNFGAICKNGYVDGGLYYTNSEKVTLVGANSSIVTAVIPNTVTTIGGGAFEGCTGLTSVTIPNSVTSIGDGAFEGCTGLTSVTIPNSVTTIGDYAFAYCIRLAPVTIPNSVTSIENQSFLHVRMINYHGSVNPLFPDYPFNAMCLNGYEEDGLYYTNSSKTVLCGVHVDKTNVIIPNTVIEIRNNAFRECTGLTSVTISNSVTSLAAELFNGCTGLTSVTIPNSVTSIGEFTFEGCTGLTSVTIPNSVTSLDGTFGGCTGLTSVTIPNSVTSIDGAFAGCTGLTSVTIPNSVTTIVDGAFAYCTGLTSVTIPNSVTSIGDGAFNGCTGLTSVTIPNSVTSVGEYAFYGCTGLTSVTIPNSVTTIGDCAFAGCSGLTSVTIPNSVTSIGFGAFSMCIGLDSLTIPNTVATIGQYAFYNVRMINYSGNAEGVPWGALWMNGYAEDSLYYTSEEKIVLIGASPFIKTADIPSTVSTIDEWAFYNCNNLERVVFHTDNPPDRASSSFAYVNNDITMQVPCGSVDNYRCVPLWIQFHNIEETVPYILTVNTVSDTTEGRVEIIQAATCNNFTAVVLATANEGYHFTMWSDSVTDNPRSLILICDTVLTALFERNEGEGIEIVEGRGVSAYPNPTRGVLYIEGEEVVRVDVYDLDGHLVMGGEHVSKIDMSALPAKVYYVRVVHKHGITISKVVKL